jgi:hypothetical protein
VGTNSDRCVGSGAHALGGSGDLASRCGERPWWALEEPLAIGHSELVRFARSVRVLSAALTALFAGAMLLIRVVLVPFWRRLSPDAFRGWFRDHSGRIGAVMFPLGAAATLSATAAAVVSRDLPRARRRPLWLAAACTIGVTVVTMVVNEPANEQFNGRDLPVEETPALLVCWRRWHTIRVLLGAVAAVSAVRGLSHHSRSHGTLPTPDRP